MQMEGTDDVDLGSDEVWCRQEEILQMNKEKRERLKKRLERQRILAEAKLIEEKEHMEITKMESEIVELNQRRSVVSRNRFIKLGNHDDMTNNSKLRMAPDKTIKHSGGCENH